MRATIFPLLLAAALSVFGGPEDAAALSSAFTYQGRLVDNGTPVSGNCDVKFDLYNAASGGTFLATQTKSNVAITDGTFTVNDLDFGTGPFAGDDRWLEISVRCPALLGAFSAPFSPRQPITAVPYALFAISSMADAGSIDFSSGNIDMANSTNAANGNILKNGVRFIHNYGTANTFVGSTAGNFSITGVGNTAAGSSALTALTSGHGNVAIGESAMLGSTSAYGNVAIGQAAMSNLVSGFQNTAIGPSALSGVTTGLHNIAIGLNAGSGLTTGKKNIYLGSTAFTADDFKVMRLGQPGEIVKTYLAGVRGASVDDTGIVGAVEVLIDSTNRIGTIRSSALVKRDIEDMGDTTARLMSLRPVTFHYKNDRTDEPQFGLIAEEVEKVFPELVAYGADGEPETIRYHLLGSMLLNELQKQNDRLARQARLINELTARLSALETRATRCDAN